MSASEASTIIAPDISIVIVSYNTKEMLRDALNALPAACGQLTFETFVVDNASPDASAEMVRTNFPDVRLVANEGNAGFVKANNQALKLATGRNLLLLNPDTEARLGSLELLSNYLDDHQNVGAIGPKLLNTDGSLQKNGRHFPRPFGELIGHTGLAKYAPLWFDLRYETGRTDFDATVEVDQVSGACIMIPKRIADEVGLLSEDFFMYYEETEWCWRIKRAGYLVIYCAVSEVVHHWMGSVRQNSFAMTERLLTSTEIYHRKTGTRFDQSTIRLVRILARGRNRWIRFGVGVKARLRKLRG